MSRIRKSNFKPENQRHTKNEKLSEYERIEKLFAKLEKIDGRRVQENVVS